MIFFLHTVCKLEGWGYTLKFRFKCTPNTTKSQRFITIPKILISETTVTIDVKTMIRFMKILLRIFSFGILMYLGWKKSKRNTWKYASSELQQRLRMPCIHLLFLFLSLYTPKINQWFILDGYIHRVHTQK